VTDSPWNVIAALEHWLSKDSKLPAETRTILQILKITEEAGEVAEAVIGATGQNPRKGFSHTWEDVEKELCDVIITSMVALARVSEDPEGTFARELARVAERALGPS
jgi:NTP pyrophosphatase (non-canonical NTP hydrolase)